MILSFGANISARNKATEGRGGRGELGDMNIILEMGLGSGKL